MDEPRSEQLLSVGVIGGLVLLMTVIGAVISDWLTLRWTIATEIGIVLLAMGGVAWTTRSRPHVTRCARCRRPSREGLYCAWCGVQHATVPPRVLDDVSIEISGGKSARLVGYGTALPLTTRDEFSTECDGQGQIMIHLITGTDRTPVRRTVAAFTSRLALSRPRQMAKIIVELRIDVTGEIEIEITEVGVDNMHHVSGFQLPVTKPPLEPAMSN